LLNDSVIDIAKQLINRRSVTPEDAGCQDAMREFLGALGFNNETMVFEDTTNLWSRRGKEGPVFCFAGHTDVVPSGPEDSENAAFYRNGNRWLFARARSGRYER